MRSGNPVLSDNTFENIANSATGGNPQAYASRMTIEGTVNKTLLMLLMTVIAAGFTWSQVLTEAGSALAWPLAIGGAIGAFIVALVTSFRPSASPYTAPVYAILEGFFLGAFSAVLERMFPGIVLQAVGLTFGVMAAMLIAYQTRLIKVTEKFVLGVVAATGGIFLVYLVSLGMSLFGVRMPFLHDGGPIAIGFSLFVVIIAALNLVLDFALIEDGAKRGAPKFMEWYGGFSLLVTLFWLYIRILDLLSMLYRRD